MKLKEIYQICIEEGIKSDLRNKKQVWEYFLDRRKKQNKLSPALKKFFDKESLKNPYADTRILHGDPNGEVRRVMVGIDMEVGELLLADHFSRHGEPVDLVMAHHPEGMALAGLMDVMRMQTDFLKNAGIRDKIAKDLMDKRIKEVSRQLYSANHMRSVDAARLLDVPYMCCHTPADNHVARYLQKLVDTKKPKTLQHVVDLLMKEQEYQEAAALGVGPTILCGTAKDSAGKILVDMTGGTEGSKDIFGRLSQIGVQTMLGMHYSEAHFNSMKSEHLHVVNAGHIASDNLGMNLLLDKIEKKGKLEIIECSGFRRVRR